MDFQLSEDQVALRDGVRSFCEGRVPVDKLSALEQEHGVDRGLWAELAEMGVFSLRLAEAEGGVGLGMADAVLVFAELGRRLVSGPLVWSHLAAEWIPEAASGECVVSGLDSSASAGGPYLVEHLGRSDRLLIVRREGVFQIDAAQLKGQPVAVPLDPLTPIHEVAELPEGELLAGPEDALRARLLGATLASGQMLGIAEATQELAVEYARGREQFGRPIGSFQVLKHMMADMFVRQEMARAAVYAAGATLDDPGVGDVMRAVAAGKIIAGDAALKNSRACIQIHGGMGYTWEVPAHFYLKRTWVLENLFGTVADHCQGMAERIEQSV